LLPILAKLAGYTPRISWLAMLNMKTGYAGDAGWLCGLIYLHIMVSNLAILAKLAV
jgi:hypothetical protein